MEELYWAAYECTTIVLESGAEKKMHKAHVGRASATQELHGQPRRARSEGYAVKGGLGAITPAS